MNSFRVRAMQMQIYPDASADASSNTATTSATFTLFKKEEFGGDNCVHVIRGTAG